MGHFFRKLVLFVLLAGFIYSILLLVWGSTYVNGDFRLNLSYYKGSYGFTNSRLKEVKKIKNIDLLFLGSSHTYRGFDTRVFNEKNITSFNLGSSAQTPMQTSILLKRYLDSLNPKTIVYEVYPNSFSSDGVESALDIISNDDNDIYSIEMALKLGNMKTYNTLYYDFLRELLNLNSSYVEPLKKRDEKYISGGFVEKKVYRYKYETHNKSKWNTNSHQLKEFENIINIIKEKKIELILVFAPISSNYYNSFENKKTFDSIMREKGKYYNFNKILKLDDSLHFYDSNHLNQNGVNLFNRKLISLLIE